MMPIPLALSFWKGPALAFLVLLMVVGGVAAVLRQTVDNLLYWDATTAAESWAKYLAENVTDIEDIANGKQPSAASMAFLIRTQQIRHVFGFEILDLRGYVQLTSDGSKISSIRGAVHSDTGARAAVLGHSIVSVKEGVPPVRPKIYAEAYLPVIVDQRPRAIVAAYVDLSEQRDQFRNHFLFAALALFLLGGMGIGVPTLAWQRMSKEKQRADQRMRQYAHRLKLALKAADAVVFEFDYAKKEYWGSDELLAMIGPERVRAAGALPLDLFAEDDRDALRAYSRRMELREDLGGIDAKLLTVEGSRWIRLYVEVERHANGEPRRAIGLMLNMDEKKKQELTLDDARKAAEAAAEAKSNFLASMSHEIRTPLNGVLGMAQSLYSDELTAEQCEKVSIILDSGSTLMALLNDVLDLSKIDAGKMDIAPIDGDLRESVMRVMQLFQLGATDKGIELTTAFDPALPERLNFDPVRVRQCVSNLLSNAIKFTAPGGRVDLQLSAAEQGGGAHIVTMRIVDTGIGMDRDTISRLFSAFTQADGSTSRRFGGSGLGLAISRQLARAMGGDIVVESELGKGSSFRLYFTAQTAAPSRAAIAQVSPVDGHAAAPSTGAASAIAGARILLVDDNAVNRQVVKLFLKPFAPSIR
jgi:signal transduction histidine kinase